MKKLFLDTGFIIALEAADDQNHQRALKHWQSLSISSPPLITTSFIFDEVVTFFNSRKRHSKAVEIGNLLLASPSVELINIDKSLFNEAWRYFILHSDKSYSLTDCVSFIVMSQNKVHVALTFDRHFVQAGFERNPISNL